MFVCLYFVSLILPSFVSFILISLQCILYLSISSHTCSFYKFGEIKETRASKLLKQSKFVVRHQRRRSPPPPVPTIGSSLISLADEEEILQSLGSFNVEDLKAQPDQSFPVKQQLCIEVLVSGHVNSFVDFFYLTHRSDDDAAKVDSMNADKLRHVKNNLSVAEMAHRRGDSEKVYEAYDQLAAHFKNYGDYKVSNTKRGG